MSLWIKWDVSAHKDAAITGLASDTQRWAFIVIIAEAKQLRSGGKFKDRKHLADVIGPRLARVIPMLIHAGLLVESEGNGIAIANYQRYQADATNAERQRRFQARMKGGDNGVEQSRAEKEQNTPISPLKKVRGMSAIGEILNGGKA